MFFVYNIFIRLYSLAIRFASLFNPKARLWVDGRKEIFSRLQTIVNHDKPIIWVHCASLGEFEQGRPVIEALKTEFPDKKILLTFFSPSGYEIRKNYPGADYIFYLPVDTRINALRFLKIVKPTLAVFVKYEYWFNYIRCLSEANIPLVYISAIFRPGQRFFETWGKWQLNQLKKVDHFFVQNDESATLLLKSGIHQVTISGDTRFDRVFSIAQQKRDFPVVEKFIQNSQILLAGSTWPVDEELIIGLISQKRPGLKFIIAPHEVHPEHIRSIMNGLPKSALKFSDADESNIRQAEVLVIDSIGILSHLYQYASIAYIGGGFGVGIHNILEAATFGKPVIFGPNYQKFQEAVEMIERGGAFSINSNEEFLKTTINLLEYPQKLQNSSQAAGDYVIEKRGATGVIMLYLKAILDKSSIY